MKKAILIHGFGESPIYGWFPEEKETLEKKGYKVLVPAMPDTLIPEKDKWVETIEKLKPGKNTILIGHSLGCPAILRYLEKAKNPVGKVFLAAPFARDLGVELVPILDFVGEPFNWGKIKKNAAEFFVITQDGDEITPVEYGMEVANNLDANLRIVKGTDHLINLDLDLINSHLE